jgi:peptidoglycan/LPS O-acetylase OafA/YrhL
MTRRRGYLAAADVLRVIAVLMVGWYHIWQQSWLNPGFSLGSHYVNLQQLVRNGYLMVDILLVLSGFLLALPHAKAAINDGSAPETREFYVKRFWRIVPSYALAVLVTLFFYALPNHLYSTSAFMLKDLLAHFTFTHNLFSDVYFNTPLPGVLWTLGVEVQFYVLFPLIACFYRERPGLTCLLLMLAGLAVRLWVYQQSDTILLVNQLPCMLDLFACGMGAAWLLTRAEQRPLSASVRWVLAIAALLCLCGIFQLLYTQTLGDGETVRHSQLLRRLPLGLLTGAFLLCGSLAPAGLNRALGNPVTRFLSQVSYNFYIWHQFLALRLKDWHIPSYVSELPNQAGEQPWQLRYTLLCFAAALVLAGAITYLIEKPLARWGTKKLR